MLNANASIYQPQAAQPKIGGPQAHPGGPGQQQSLPPHMTGIRGQAPFQTYMGPGPNRVAGMQPPHRPQYAAHPPSFPPALVHQQQQQAAALAAATAAASSQHRGNNSMQHPNAGQVNSSNSSHRGNNSMHHNSQVTAAQQAAAASAAAAHQQHQQAHPHQQAMANHQQQIHHQHPHQHQHQHGGVAAANLSHRQNAAGGGLGGGPPQMSMQANRMPPMQYYTMPYQHPSHNPMQIYLPSQQMMVGGLGQRVPVNIPFFLLFPSSFIDIFLFTLLQPYAHLNPYQIEVCKCLLVVCLLFVII